MELRRRGVQDLATAIAEAESLIDFTKSESSKSKEKDWKTRHEEDGDKKTAQRKEDHGQTKEDHARKPPLPKDRDPRPVSKSNQCFICDGSHWTRDCPKKAKLNAIEASEEVCQEEDICMGSMQILNAMNANTNVPKVETKGLQFVEVNIQGSRIRALVDTGATHNFISVDEAKRLGIHATKGSGTLKIVNSDAKPIHGVAKNVRARIGDWEGTIDLSVVPMDDFRLVLGIEFFDKVQAFPMPFASSLCILDGGKTCMVNTVRGPRSYGTILSAMQFKNGYNKEKTKKWVPKKVPTMVKTSFDKEVEEIISDRTIQQRGVPGYKEYLVKWKDLPDSKASWEAENTLWQFGDKIKKYHDERTKKTRRGRREFGWGRMSRPA